MNSCLFDETFWFNVAGNLEVNNLKFGAAVGLIRCALLREATDSDLIISLKV